MWPFASTSLDRASFILRRLAWSEDKPMTQCLDSHLTQLANDHAGDRVCTACREHNGHINQFNGDSQCVGCLLHPVENIERIAA